MKRIFFALSLVVSLLAHSQEDYPFVAETDPQATEIRRMAGLEVWLTDALGAVFRMGRCGIMESMPGR